MSQNDIEKIRVQTQKSTDGNRSDEIHPSCQNEIEILYPVKRGRS